MKVADCGGFTRAAIELDTSHSGLSRQVQELESTLGYQVFRRTGRGVKLTDAGKKLYEHSRHLLEVAERVGDEALGLRGVVTGTVGIGMPGSVAQVIASPLAAALGESHPQVRARIVEGLSGSIEEQLASGRLDLGLLFTPDEKMPSEHEALFLSDLYLVGPAGSSLLRRPEVPLEKLEGLRLVLPGPPHSIRQALDRALAAASLRIELGHEVESMATMKRLVEDGFGYTVSTWSSVAGEVAEGRLAAARIVRPVLARGLVLARGRNQPATAAANVVLDHLRSIIRALVRDPRMKWRAPPAGPRR